MSDQPATQVPHPIRIGCQIDPETAVDLQINKPWSDNQAAGINLMRVGGRSNVRLLAYARDFVVY